VYTCEVIYRGGEFKLRGEFKLQSYNRSENRRAEQVIPGELITMKMGRR
jgi:hypothetical protein